MKIETITLNIKIARSVLIIFREFYFNNFGAWNNLNNFIKYFYPFYYNLKNVIIFCRKIHSKRAFAKSFPVTALVICLSKTFWICCLCLVDRRRGTSKCFMLLRYMVNRLLVYINRACRRYISETSK